MIKAISQNEIPIVNEQIKLAMEVGEVRVAIKEGFSYATKKSCRKSLNLTFKGKRAYTYNCKSYLI